MLTGRVPAHPVTDHDQRVEAGLIAPDRDRILVLFSLETWVCGPRDT